MASRKCKFVSDNTKIVVHLNIGPVETMTYKQLKKNILNKIYEKRKPVEYVKFIEVEGKDKYYRVDYYPTKGFRLLSYDPRSEGNRPTRNNSAGGYL